MARRTCGAGCGRLGEPSLPFGICVLYNLLLERQEMNDDYSKLEQELGDRLLGRARAPISGRGADSLNPE